MKRKLFCVWMCIAMIVTLMPSMAFAEDTSLSTEADIDMENEAVASPAVQAASTSNAIAGTIAVTQKKTRRSFRCFYSGAKNYCTLISDGRRGMIQKK